MERRNIGIGGHNEDTEIAPADGNIHRTLGFHSDDHTRDRYLVII